MSLAFISIMLTGLISPLSAKTKSTSAINTIEITSLSSNTVSYSEGSNTNRTTPIIQSKKILVDKSRGLSAFFIFGIAINIIMAITFGWWFSKEWRSSKNKKVEDL